MTQSKKRSPRCPSMSLEEAIQRIDALYEKENKHAVAPDAAAQGLGHKDANGGAAKTTIASVSYYGLLNRSPDGKLSVSPEFEKFKYAPHNDIKNVFLNNWLRNPKIFSDLIQKYGENFPSDSALKYELIEFGFIPDTADEAIKVLKKSIEYVKKQGVIIASDEYLPNEEENNSTKQVDTQSVVNFASNKEKNLLLQKDASTILPITGDFKTITIFLPRGREAMLYVPRPFFEKDREAIKRQIDALLTDDEDSNE